jgi:hypothetical protein
MCLTLSTVTLQAVQMLFVAVSWGNEQQGRNNCANDEEVFPSSTLLSVCNSYRSRHMFL